MTMVDNRKSAIADEMAAVNGAQTPGARLQAARQRAGLEVADVARQLNLLEWQVKALEQDCYEKFPADLFVKGYLRSYARLLKLDVDQILNAYRLQCPRREPQTAPRPEPRRPVSLDATRQRRYWGLVASALVVLALWGWQQSRERAEILPLTADTGIEESAAAGGIDAALNGGAEAALLDSVQLVSAPALAPTVPVEGVEQPAAAPVSAATVQTNAGDQLSLRFSADCWVEIKDRDNKLLVAVLKHADDELKIEGRGPFKVLLGYAPGVEMAYNGTPVKVDAADRSHSARIIVGNS